MYQIPICKYEDFFVFLFHLIIVSVSMDILMQVLDLGELGHN